MNLKGNTKQMLHKFGIAKLALSGMAALSILSIYFLFFGGGSTAIGIGLSITTLLLFILWNESSKSKSNINAIRILPFVLVGLTLSSFSYAEYVNWKVDEDKYEVKFTSDKFKGSFTGLQSQINFDESNLGASKLSATIDATSVKTGIWLRNKHARIALDAENYPKIKFESTSVSKIATGYEIQGNLTIKNITKKITFPFTFTNTPQGGTFAGKFPVVPDDYTVAKAGTPDVVEVILSIPVIKG